MKLLAVESGTLVALFFYGCFLSVQPTNKIFILLFLGVLLNLPIIVDSLGHAPQYSFPRFQTSQVIHQAHIFLLDTSFDPHTNPLRMAPTVPILQMRKLMPVGSGDLPEVIQ